MKIRIGDLVTVKGKQGFVTSVAGWFLSYGCIEITYKRKDLRSIELRKDITKVIPRRLVTEYWKYI